MFPLPLRIIPVLVIAAIPLLGLKMYDIVGALAAQAVQPAEAKPAPNPAAPAAPRAVQPPAATAAPDAKMATSQPGPVERAAQPAAAHDTAALSGGEIDLLGALSQRRAELDKRAAELDERALVLKATEAKISEKITELKRLQATIDQSLQERDAKDDARIGTLVRIYQLMKPQDAARIFEQLDMPVLLEVVAHMKEAKAAPILAAMQPEKAKALTLALAEQHRTAQQ